MRLWRRLWPERDCEQTQIDQYIAAIQARLDAMPERPGERDWISAVQGLRFSPMTAPGVSPTQRSWSQPSPPCYART